MPMRMKTLAIALVATLAIPALATAQSGRSNMGDTPGSSNNAGNPPGGNTVQGPKTNQGKGGATTGQGVGGSVGGNATRPGGTNNEQSGTQSHDAQKGGGGKDGAR
jgi:hypothetical protein